MSLTAALSAARSSLSATALQTSVIARNVTGANEPLYTRKSADLVSIGGGVRVAGITRSADDALMRMMLKAASDAMGLRAIGDGLDRLEQTVGDPENDRSPAASLGSLRDLLQQLSSTPDNPVLAQGVVNGAEDMARALGDASSLIQTVRGEADAAIASGVDRVNTLLARLEPLNGDINSRTERGDDVTAELDERDRLVADIADEIGIRTLIREPNDLMILTESGVTLFETTPRTVSFKPLSAFAATTVAEAIYVDGVPVIGPTPSMAVTSGRLAGLAALRDQVAPGYQDQIDEIARGVIEAFAESDQNDPATAPTIVGLFTWSGAPALPPTGTIMKGLAAEIRVNPNVVPALGGDLDRLRDGGIGDPGNPAYVYNTGNASGYSGRLDTLIDRMTETRNFDPATGVDSTNSLLGFASSSVSWLGAMRQDTLGKADLQAAVSARASEALSHATGVNIDEELTILLELERSYQASSRLLSTVDEMMVALLNAVR